MCVCETGRRHWVVTIIDNTSFSSASHSSTLFFSFVHYLLIASYLLFTLQYTFLLIESKHKSIIDHRINYENKQNNKIKWIENRKNFLLARQYDESFARLNFRSHLFFSLMCSLTLSLFLFHSLAFSIFSLDSFLLSFKRTEEKGSVRVRCDLYKNDFLTNFFFCNVPIPCHLMVSQQCCNSCHISWATE